MSPRPAGSSLRAARPRDTVRIAFDASPLERPYPLGVARATRGLVEALERRGVLEVVRLAPAPGEPERRWRQRVLPAAAERAAAIGIHSPVSAFALRGPGLRVQTVHELPWRHGVRENAGLTHRLWARLGVARADAVLTPTALVRDELLHECGGGERRVHACPWGVGPVSPPPETVLRGARERVGVGDGPFGLVLGGTRAKKDLAASLRGLARLQEHGGPELALLVTGPPSADLEADLALARRLGVAARVHAAGTVEEDELAALVAGAAVVLVLSRSEGFGLPALEALAAGTPVLVSSGSAQAEVAGDAGLEVDPRDADDVARGLRRALEDDPARRRRGEARAAELSWDRCATQVEDLWTALGRSGA